MNKFINNNLKTFVSSNTEKRVIADEYPQKNVSFSSFFSPSTTSFCGKNGKEKVLGVWCTKIMVSIKMTRKWPSHQF